MSKSFKDIASSIFNIGACYKSNKLNPPSSSSTTLELYACEEAIYMDDDENVTCYMSTKKSFDPPKNIDKKQLIDKLKLSKLLLKQCVQKDVIYDQKKHGKYDVKCLECDKHVAKVILFPCEHRFCWECINNMLKAEGCEECIFCSESIKQAVKINNN